MQGSKKVPSAFPGQVDFLAGQISFQAHLPNGPVYSIHPVYSFFKKGCWKKCTQQSRKVLWVVLSSLFFKEI